MKSSMGETEVLSEQNFSHDQEDGQRKQRFY